jgi:hypothetical protein
MDEDWNFGDWFLGLCIFGKSEKLLQIISVIINMDCLFPAGNNHTAPFRSGHGP